jgi:hypothetical protein
MEFSTDFVDWRHSRMFVFLTHLVNLCLSNLLSDGPLPPPPSIPVCFACVYTVHSKYKGSGWSLVDLRNVGSCFLNRDRLKYNFHSQFKTMASYVFHFPDPMSHTAEKSCLELRTSYPASRICIKVTTPRKRLTDFVC